MTHVRGHDAKALGVELKPCPFCGNKVETWMIDHDNRSLEQVIDCVHCPCSMSSYLAYGSSEPLNQSKRDRLFDAWNTRIEVKDEDMV